MGQDITTAHANPASAQIGGLFGQYGEVDQKGWNVVGMEDWGSSNKNVKAAPTIFGPEGMAAIAEYLTNPPEMSAVGDFAREKIGGIDNLTDLFAKYQQASDKGWESLGEGLETGWKVDTSPIRENAMFQLMNETMPGLAESFAGTTGIASSDFGRSLSRAGAGMEAELGQLEYDAASAAAARQAAVTTDAGAIMSNMLSAPTNWASGVSEMEAYQRNLAGQATEGAGLWNAFQQVSGMDTQPATIAKPDTGPTGMEIFNTAVMPGVGG